MKIPDKLAYEILKKYQIETARYAFVKDLAGAKTALGKLTTPLVLKIDSPDIIHKSDSGCVQVAFSDGDIGAKFRSVMKNAKRVGGKINGVIIQEMVEGKEMMIGSKVDGQFGPVICFGLGGIFVEALHDVSFRLIPIKKSDAMQMVTGTRAHDVLRSRGESDINSVVDTLLRVSRLIEKEGIKELDINPLMVTKKGAIAVDVRMIK